MKALLEKIKALVSQANAIEAGVKARDTEITEDEQAKINSLMDEIDVIQVEVDKLKAAEVTMARLAKTKANIEASLKEPAPKTAPGISEPIDTPADVSVVKMGIEDDPQRGFKSYGMFCDDIYMAGRQPESIVSERLKKCQASYGANTLVGEEGSYIIPEGFSNTMFKRAVEILPILNQCLKVGMSVPSLTLTAVKDDDKNAAAYRHGGVIVYWPGEGGQITKSQLKWREINMRLHPVAALSFATYQMLKYVTNYGSILMQTHGDAIADEFVEKVMFGTGAGCPLGAFKSAACVSQAKKAGQAADTVIRENIANMWSIIHTPAKGKGAWYYNGEVYPQLEQMELTVGTGGVATFIPAGGYSAKPYDTLKGRSAYETDHCEALGDEGDIVFGDFSDYVLAMGSAGPEMAVSIHLRFDYAETAFRSIAEIDGLPWWENTLRPRKGATARRVSPWVKLAERA